LILGLAERWGCPPSRVLDEPAWVLRLLKIEGMGKREDPE